MRARARVCVLQDLVSPAPNLKHMYAVLFSMSNAKMKFHLTQLRVFMPRGHGLLSA